MFVYSRTDQALRSVFRSVFITCEENRKVFMKCCGFSQSQLRVINISQTDLKVKVIRPPLATFAVGTSTGALAHTLQVVSFDP